MKRISITTIICWLSSPLFAQFNIANCNLSFYKNNGYSLKTDSLQLVSAQAQFKDTLRSEEKKWTHDKLRIYPIVANEVFKKESSKTSNYLSLKEALDKKVIQISEVSTGGTVNSLKLTNTGKDTILILAGEVVLGGKQNRALAEELLLAPQDKNRVVKVFCVEAGRWRNQGSYNFGKYYGFAGGQVRKKVVIDKNQTKVWSEISKTHKKAGVSSSTQTFTAIKESKSYREALDSYKKYFLPQLLAENGTLGFVAVTGNKVLGVELFSSHDQFKKQVEKLLESYVTEAVLEGSAVVMSTLAVEKYLVSLLSASKQKEMTEKNGTEVSNGKKKVHMSIMGK